MAAASRTAKVYEALRQALLDSVYPPGGKLAIIHLAEHYGVSAGAIREALSRLTSDRLVVCQPQRGFIAAPVSAGDLIDLTEVRIEIETRCLRRSIALGTQEWEDRLISLWRRLSRTVWLDANMMDRKEWCRLHDAFHDQLLSCCDSRWWLQLRGELYTQAERYRRMTLPIEGVRRDINAEHQTIVTHALARDGERACLALRDHLQRTTDILLASNPLILQEEQTSDSH
ncbi:FCD domain-containing protein [Martelella alba]|uniref:FCD domain-containing protein n=1 Tax=Martelella alba TaxID=2590451 RepID=A0A506U2T6_9HYPH|nr:FCD domain-containing protein [Martelella alba]TPW27344.1 FCD domain-containing protein [Martelella alba]